MGGKPGSGTEPRAPRDPSQWRADLIDPALTILIVALTVMLGIGIPLVPPPRFQAPFFALVIVILALVVLRLARRQPLWLRAGGAALGVLAAAVVGATQLGFGPGLTIALAMIGAILSIALGRGAAVLFFALAAASMLVLGKLAVDGSLPLRAGSQDPAELVNWVRWISVFFVSGTALALVLHVVVRRIEAAARAQVAADKEHRRCTDALLLLAQNPVVESGKLDAAFAAIADAATVGLDVARAGVWTLEDGGQTLRCAAIHPDASPAPHSLAIADHAAYFAALAEGRTIAVSDASADGRTAELAGALAVRGVSSVLMAPIRFREQLAGAIALEHVGPVHTWSAEARSFAAALADDAARALAAAEREQKDAELREAYDLLGRLHRRVETAKEEERRHLARDMHDELGQILTALKLRLQMAMKSGTGGGVLEASIDMVDRLIARARKMSIDLSPPLLDEVGLAPAIRAHLERGITPPEMRVDLDTAGLDERLPAEVETAAFRVVQESLTNAVRHAEAHRVEISVRREVGHLALLVRDDGRGFDVAEARRASGRGEHFGVVGMAERVKGLGGTLEVRSGPGQGTEVHATLPVAPPR
jgi:signal transduction histidine kinase